MSQRDSAFMHIFRHTYGMHFLDLLTIRGAGFMGGQRCVAAARRIDTNFLSDRHPERNSGFFSLRDGAGIIVVDPFDLSLF